ncbi:MAG: sugar phosphate isomerase/epimerase [Eubacteriales bacterium]|nr:sugar phosphate isomerase/epimerase [Eubacteriales bacterium]
MDIIVSHLPYIGYGIFNMAEIPKEYGVEIFVEYGDDYYWKHQLKKIMAGRTGKLSVHGPFCEINLAAEDCAFDEVKESFKRAFDMVNRYHAVHCVLHPHAQIPYPGFNLKEGHQRALERTLILDEMARRQEVELLVENMPYTEQLMDQEAFLETFGPEKQLRFLIDTGHAILNHWDMAEVWRVLGTRIRAYHVHDNYADYDAHLKIGEGPTDWNKFFQDYKRYTPDARLVLEYAQGPIRSIVENIETVKHIYENA